MKKLFVVVVSMCLVGLPAQIGHTTALDEPEGCQVFNPAQPTCSYTATHEGESPVTGIFGWGTWIVKIKVGKKTTVHKSPGAGEPTAVEIPIPKGAQVTMTAVSPGAGGTVGHVD